MSELLVASLLGLVGAGIGELFIRQFDVNTWRRAVAQVEKERQ